MKILISFLTCHSYPYDMNKVNILKSILPFFIILHHVSQLGFVGDVAIGGNKIMFIFFAMSGFGLVHCFKNNPAYLDIFLKRSLSKLFIPYVVCLVIFILYRRIEGISNIDILHKVGVLDFVQGGWYIYILALFYVVFFVIFKNLKSPLALKVALVGAFVIGYTCIAPLLGLRAHTYCRCPAFITGLIFGFYDDIIMRSMARWKLILLVALAFALLLIPHNSTTFDSLIYPSIVFLLMYSIPNIKATRLVWFISSISLEIYLFHMLAFYIVTRDLQFESKYAVFPLTVCLAIVIAWLIHSGIKNAKEHYAVK